MINDWILANAAYRAVWCIDTQNGPWRIGLAVNTAHDQCERLPCGVAPEYEAAARRSVEIAREAGYP